MKYKIKEQHKLKLPIYLIESFLTRIEAEDFLETIKKEKDIVYSIVYGKTYHGSGSFGEFKEPT
jgi:hypothetical protein